MGATIEFDQGLLEALDDYRAAPQGNAKAERYLGLLRAGSGERILDVGCGGGWFARQLVRLVEPRGRVVGIDNSGQQLTSPHDAQATCAVDTVLQTR